MKWAFWVTVALLVSGCCSFPECAEERSAKDRARSGAKPVLKTGVVINDSVSAPGRDRTDWRSVVVRCKGRLRVELHWDKSGNDLDLTMFNAMGAKIMDGQPWGVLGESALLAVENAGTRFYVRVQARGEDDESTYALRVTPECEDKPEAPMPLCVPCKPGERKCVEDEGFVTCEQKSAGCTIWSQPTACPEGQGCKDGVCGRSCDTCSKGKSRCVKGALQRCVKKGDCWVWGKARSCGRRKVCKGGRCVCRGRNCGGTTTTVEPVKPEPKATCIPGKVISMYPYHGQRMLNIRVTGSKPVQAGMTGYVLQGETSKPLANGKFRITRVSGKNCTATTSLVNVGMNQRVCIKSK